MDDLLASVTPWLTLALTFVTLLTTLNGPLRRWMEARRAESEAAAAEHRAVTAATGLVPDIIQDLTLHVRRSHRDVLAIIELLDVVTEQHHDEVPDRVRSYLDRRREEAHAGYEGIDVPRELRRLASEQQQRDRDRNP